MMTESIEQIQIEHLTKYTILNNKHSTYKNTSRKSKWKNKDLDA